MKNTIKMSLVAALAVAGLSTAAAAEDTKFSGKLYVENTNATVNDGSSLNHFEIDFDVTGKKKISDTLTAVVGIEADSDNDEDDNLAKKTVTVDDAYFAYANNGATAKFGRQGMNTPTTDGELGEGLMATYTMGAITVAGAHYDVNEFAAEANVLAVLGTAGPVNFELWQVNVQGASENTTGVVSGKAAGWNLSLRHAMTDYDGATADGSTTKIVASGKVDKVALTVVGVSTDKDGPVYVTDASSANAAELTYFNSRYTKDLAAFAVIASMPFTDKVSGTVKYGAASFDQTGTDDDSASELVLQVNYKLAKSATMTARYSDYTQEIANTDTDKEQLRVDLTYKF